MPKGRDLYAAGFAGVTGHDLGGQKHCIQVQGYLGRSLSRSLREG